MLGNQKGSSKMIVLLAIVTLLSFCSPASSFAFLPRVSRTDDAVIIDFDGVGYAPSYQGLYDQIDDPRFVLLPSFYPVPMTYRQQEETPNGWIYSYGYSTPLRLEDVLPVRQSPATQCGTGPVMPARRELTSERIAGGTSAKKNAWPFIVALKKSDDSLFCSGTLISDTRVLLAAQCLEKMSLFELSGVTVLVGMFLTDQSDVQMTRRISKLFLHRQFNAATYANDIAIIVMDAPVVLSRSVAPACLPVASTDPDQFVDQDAVILGWGGGTVDASLTEIITPYVNLQQAKVSIWSNGDCKGDATAGRYVTENTTCITSATGDKFTCTPADVGGPVVILPSPGSWTVVGINSYTKDCATSGLKTRVSAYRAWINQYMTMA
ncbi:transmembrane protease serine 11D-like [Daphnia pulex]|uniref:transmembrane protease serine 11D-like n=1 Tax=Daphnia pulex TaxID=6669 RepID=UPI001EDF93F8|nr:transmembrane protease serine 11D-like [Daphnia pulex]XP_046457648.1 transmembrane protease serine 11D-like [Daphnia pulex]XP_046457649.1 transmembrane protease serine 11D-like [Daphnia pulex]XP_046457650.1 transmembrane protease serine 11D-like [Daphnia pulex]XP_046457651.1 transmembrane protease serine 11D-like [Daphnia pulex]XP_046457652.1 transmembrane protease serine 11D-like [Daphnia pulex]